MSADFEFFLLYHELRALVRNSKVVLASSYHNHPSIISTCLERKSPLPGHSPSFDTYISTLRQFLSNKISMEAGRHRGLEKRDEPCTAWGCRARKFYNDDSGQTICARGHVQEVHTCNFNLGILFGNLIVTGTNTNSRERRNFRGS